MAKTKREIEEEIRAAYLREKYPHYYTIAATYPDGSTAQVVREGMRAALDQLAQYLNDETRPASVEIKDDRGVVTKVQNMS